MVYFAFTVSNSLNGYRSQANPCRAVRFGMYPDLEMDRSMSGQIVASQGSRQIMFIHILIAPDGLTHLLRMATATSGWA
jgi:hypothetical protein